MLAVILILAGAALVYVGWTGQAASVKKAVAA